ncbi:MAG: inositol monophosphatase [Nitrospira sp.]|nr:inositol monophosphatase [Nitrospira sp.]MCW5786801.1 inositol monophosphatase [Nitrospira sp.]
MQPMHIPSADERSTYLATAVRAAEAAGTVLLNYAKSGFRIDYKAAINLVTDADRQAEDCIVRTILSAHPSHRILAEERGQDGSPDSPYQWIIDPLDGTTNFAHGFPFYAVSIGLEYHGECILGVVSDPVRRELFTGIVGEGAYLNGERLCVSPIDELERSLLVTGFAYNIRETADNNLDHFSRISLRAQAIRRTGSAALDLCYVASGRFDGYWEVKLSPWDMAAGIVMVREAGGVVSGFTTNRFSLYGQELVATNGRIHRQLLDAIHQRTDSGSST